MKNRVFTPEELLSARLLRWRCRTDLEFLAREILGYKDIDRSVHGPVLDVLQKFPYPKNKEEFEEHDVWNGKTWRYRPLKDMQALPGDRRVLILDPRGHLKTTINAQSHTIQWILNYPDIAIAIFQSNLEKAELILGEIRRHFQFNERLRQIFPEFCPQKLNDFGTKGAFTVPARSPAVTRREPTLMALSIEKGLAGLHFDVMKFSDIVEPENVKTDDRIADIKASFYMAENLLVSPVFWIDVEGTRYHHGDLYGELVDKWMRERKEGLLHKYRIHVRGCFKKQMESGEEYTPDKLARPEILRSDKTPIPIWEFDAKGHPRFPLEHLLELQRNNAYIFSCQQLNQPSGAGGDVAFPQDKIISRNTISPKHFRENVRVHHYEVTIDTAETVNARSNYTAIAVSAWDSAGRCYIVELVHEKLLPKALVDKIFALNAKYKPTRIAIEETGFVRGLHAAIERTSEMLGVYLPLEFLKRDNREAKTERIVKTLQPWYISGDLRFVVDFEKEPAWWEALCKELREFPVGTTDDILDALADQFQGKDYFGRLQGQPSQEAGRNVELERFLGVLDPFSEDNSEEPRLNANDPFLATGYL